MNEERGRIPEACPVCRGRIVVATFPYALRCSIGGVMTDVHLEGLTAPRCVECDEILFTGDASSQLDAAIGIAKAETRSQQ